jgi:hypothetical protein
LVGVNTDRCHPFLGRGTAKKPIGGTLEVGIEQPMKWRKKIDPLIKDEQRSILACRENFFVPRGEMRNDLSFL